MSCKGKKLSATEMWAVERLNGCKNAKAKARSGLVKPSDYAYKLLGSAQSLRQERRFLIQNGQDPQVLVKQYESRISEINDTLAKLRQERQELSLMVRASHLVDVSTQFRNKTIASKPQSVPTNLHKQPCDSQHTPTSYKGASQVYKGEGNQE